jgi:hypothetical protein
MGAIIAAAKQLQELLGGLVVLVHHTGKVVENGMRGHSSLFAAMDGVIGVSSSKESGLSWTVAKSKDDATGAIHAFRLEQIIVGIDDEGEDVTSCRPAHCCTARAPQEQTFRPESTKSQRRSPATV